MFEKEQSEFDHAEGETLGFIRILRYAGEMHEGKGNDINFIIGDGVVTAQLETDWFDVRGFGEGRCDNGDRRCAFVSAVQSRLNKESPIHCGCRGSQEHHTLNRRQMDDIIAIAGYILKAKFDDDVTSYL